MKGSVEAALLREGLGTCGNQPLGGQHHGKQAQLDAPVKWGDQAVKHEASETGCHAVCSMPHSLTTKHTLLNEKASLTKEDHAIRGVYEHKREVQ